MAQQDSKSGHVKLVERKRGPKFYAKFRSNGHQTTRLIGRAWLKRGRPPEGWFTRRMAEVETTREGGVLTIRHTKFGKSRLVPLHPTAFDLPEERPIS